MPWLSKARSPGRLGGSLPRPAPCKTSRVETNAFPDIITIASGGFTVDTQQLTFEKLQTASQDAALTLSGSLKGFPQRLERIDLSLDGSMGPQSVEWLSDRLKVPESYAIHAPLSISNGADLLAAGLHDLLQGFGCRRARSCDHRRCRLSAGTTAGQPAAYQGPVLRCRHGLRPQ